MDVKNRPVVVASLAMFLTLSLRAGTSVTPAQNAAAPPAPAAATSRLAVLGPEDQVVIRVLDEEEIPDKPFPVDSDGLLHLPLVGTVQAAGLTTRELEAALTAKLKVYVKDPHVSVTLVELHSRSVSVVGAVNSPGIHQIEGPHTLLDVISMSGGLRPDAGATARITRQSEWGTLPLPGARQDLSGKFSVADVDLDSLLRGKTPAENITIQPHDVIAVTKADLVFVLGEVKKPGGFPIMSHERISILTAVGLAEGIFPSAAAKSARILRDRSDGQSREQIPVNLAKILRGEAPDVSLMPNDILLVPRNVARDVAIRSAEAAVAVGTGLVIWRR